MQPKSSIQKTQQYFSTFDPRYFSQQIQVTSVPMTDDLRRWIAENKFVGVDDLLLVQELINHGISPSAANHEVSIVNKNPYFQAGQKPVQLLKKHESHANILTELAALSLRSRTIERRETISRNDFLENYYAKNVPLILTGITENWCSLSLES